MDFGNFFETVYNLALNLIKVISSVWDWLSEPLIENFSPIDLLGVGILVLIGVWVVKELL